MIFVVIWFYINKLNWTEWICSVSCEAPFSQCTSSDFGQYQLPLDLQVMLPRFHWQPDNWHIWQPWQHKITESSERYVHYNIARIYPWRWKIYYMIIWGQYSTERLILEKGQITYWTHKRPDLCLCSLYTAKHDSDAATVSYFSSKKCTTVVTTAAFTLNSHLSFRFTSAIIVPNPIWSCLEFIKVLYVWRRQQATYNAVSV